MSRVSVILPVYNSAETIKAVIDSVLHQTAFNEIKEIMIVDDGSTDSSPDIVKNIILDNPKVPIKCIRQKNSGVSCARNVGMENATGEFIAFFRCR